MTTFTIYQIYDFLDTILLWIPYPAMLINRAIAGFSGMNSAAMRRRAVQTAFPDNLRARINAAQNILSNAFALARDGLFADHDRVRLDSDLGEPGRRRPDL